MSQLDFSVREGAPPTGKALLRERAEALARVPPAPARAEDFLEVIEFVLAGEHYALATARVREVVPLKELTPLPGTPAFVRGLINVRRQILTVIDLGRLLELPERGLPDLHRVIILQADGMELGLVAEAVLRVRTLLLDQIQPPPPARAGGRAEYLRGVTDERLVILDVERLLADPRLIVDEAVEAGAGKGAED